MKKWIAILMAAVLLLNLLAACGKKTEAAQNESPTVQPTTNQSTQKEETPKTEAEPETDPLLPGTLKITTVEVYVDVPELHLIKQGYMRLFHDAEKKYVAVVCPYNESASTPDEAYDITFPMFLSSALNYVNAQDVGTVTTEYVTVNGIETRSFEGALVIGKDAPRDVYAKGYAFAFDGYPCLILGFVYQKDQPQEEIDYIREVVDAMMPTVRNTK